jgi:hypothetical protein
VVSWFWAAVIWGGAFLLPIALLILLWIAGAARHHWRRSVAGRLALGQQRFVLVPIAVAIVVAVLLGYLLAFVA